MKKSTGISVDSIYIETRCANATLDVCGSGAKDVEECLFKSEVTVIALAQQEALKEDARGMKWLVITRVLFFKFCFRCN